MTNGDVYSRGGQVSCDNLQNLGIALWGIAESRGVDKGHFPPVEIELVRELDLACARRQARSDS